MVQFLGSITEDFQLSESDSVQSKFVYDLNEIIHSTMISYFMINGNNLFLLLRGSDDPLYKISFKENSVSVHGGYGEWGRGPGEFSLPAYFGFDSKDRDNVIIFDQRNRNIVFTDQDLFVSQQYLTSLDIGTFAFVNDKIYANGDFFDDKAIAILENKDGAFVLADAIGKAVFSSENTSYSPAVLVHLNRSSLVPDPDVKFFAKAYLYTPVIQIFNINGDLVKQLNIDEDFNFHYRIVFDNREKIDRFLRTKETKFAYLSVAGSSDYIYALYSGRSEASHKSDEQFFKYFAGNEIHVFDWSGNFIKKVIMDYDVNRIFCNSDSGQLYGMSMYEDYYLVNFGSF